MKTDAEEQLGDLLAIIFRDGGQHQNAVGRDQSVEDAKHLILERHSKSDAEAMYQRSMKSDAEGVIEERNDAYRDAWKKAGLMMEPVADDVAHLLKTVPEFFSPWNIMMSKMARILGSPHNKDHWLDIAGYAMLVVHDIEAQNESVSSS